MIAKWAEGPLEPACRERVYEIDWQDLPLSCPAPWMELWNAHPRVYLPIHRTGRERCEWCGAEYVLRPPDPDAPTPNFDNAEIETRYRQALAAVKGRDGNDPEVAQSSAG